MGATRIAGKSRKLSGVYKMQRMKGKLLMERDVKLDVFNYRGKITRRPQRSLHWLFFHQRRTFNQQIVLPAQQSDEGFNFEGCLYGKGKKMNVVHNANLQSANYSR